MHGSPTQRRPTDVTRRPDLWWPVVVALVLVRPTLDAVTLVDAGAIAGAFFTIGSVLWLARRRTAGTLVPLSRPARWALGTCGALALAATTAEDLPGSLLLAAKTTTGMLMLVVAEQCFADRPDRGRHVPEILAAALAVPAVVAVGQLGSSTPYDPWVDVGRVRGTFVHPNPFAAALVTVVAVALAARSERGDRARRACTVVALVAGALLVLTYTRGAWLGAAVAVVVVGVLTERRVLAWGVAAAVGCVVAVPSVTTRLSDLSAGPRAGGGDRNSLVWRLDYWEELVPRIADRPLFGGGPGSVAATSVGGFAPHNGFLQAFVEAGLVGGILLLGTIVVTVATLHAARRRGTDRVPRPVVAAAAAAGLAWVVQLGADNLLTQALPLWFVALAVARVTAVRAG